MDNKVLTQDVIDKLDKDIQSHPVSERSQLIDWLMANQLTKDKKNITLIESRENSPSPLQRRLFWYYQCRLRWVGQVPPDNTEYLLSTIEANIAREVQPLRLSMYLTEIFTR